MWTLLPVLFKHIVINLANSMGIPFSKRILYNISVLTMLCGSVTMAWCIQIVDGGYGLQIWRVSGITLNKQLWAADKGWSSSLVG